MKKSKRKKERTRVKEEKEEMRGEVWIVKR